jgi:uncharacterized OB-fold protein
MTLLKPDPHAPQAWPGNLPVTSRYTYGLAGERFFRLIKDEGRIYGTHCPQCDITYVPARAFCERCLSELDEWVDVGIQGAVHTFTQLWVDYDGSSLDVPRLVAFIKIADGGLVHDLVDVELEDVVIGMAVEAIFKKSEERQGSITDILHFKPVEV